ncbi:MAG: diguanylate cyclase, partial [Burkholderiales bacterium]|nr:diguanylate cyclase [Burkholderiales bacterium]
QRFQEYCDYPEALCQRGTTYEALLRYNEIRCDYGADGEQQVQASLHQVQNGQSARWEARVHNLVLEVFRDPLPTGGFVITFTDITERWHAEQRARHQANHDALTGLPNRLLFRQLLQDQLAIAREVSTVLTVLFIDLDGFKAVNDTYGHATGDAVLMEAAQRLRHKVRVADVVARQGGDEFLALLVGANDEQSCQIANAIIASLQVPVPVNGVEISIGASIGIAQFPTAGTDADALLKAADDAMYRAKMSGKGRCCVARPIST